MAETRTSSTLPAQTVWLLRAARQIAREMPADAILLLTETELDWDAVLDELSGCRLLVAAHRPELADKLRKVKNIVFLDIDPSPAVIRDRLGLALLEAIATEHLKPGAHVVALYNGVETADQPDQIDSLSLLHLGEHLERLTASELRRLETRVPLETLRAVVDLAIEIGREGREGHPVGTMFVVGDTRRVLQYTRVIGFDPVRGYSRRERNIRDRRVRESLKEIAKLDGAIIVNRDGTVEAAARLIDCAADGITLSKGLGSRHWAAAAISKRTKAIAVTVSESTGAVRLFQNGEVVLYIEPMARPMVWRQMRMEATENGSDRPAGPETS
ncbi:MAG: diadenylate cyclase [Gemmatales bacterium]|nr:diadenylate cyclase [Gemmatales bacterium]MDW8386103.1 diadenylate cyclase [Gemmatales bacterium]